MGIDANQVGTVDNTARVQIGVRTMYAMMGAGTYGCSGVAPSVVSHLRKVFALPRMLYGLEVYSLNSKDVQQLEQLHRSFMKRSKCIPINTTTSAAYSLLGIRPIQQELDLMKLTLLGNVLFSNKHTHTYTHTHTHTHTHTKKTKKNKQKKQTNKQTKKKKKKKNTWIRD